MVEIILVLLIAIVVTTFTIAQFRIADPQFDRQNIARQLKVGLERARFDSVKRRTSNVATQARVIVDESWFSVITDANGTGSIESNDSEKTHFGNRNLSITGKNMVFPVTLTYDEQGCVTAKGSDNVVIDPVFYVCNGICNYATVTPGNTNIVLVSPAETVNLLDGNAPLPTFSNPSVSAVDAGSSINCEVAISMASRLTTATPATPTPTVTPTVYESSPTTPAVCEANQKPSLTKCSCAVPMTVKTNGKCTL